MSRTTIMPSLGLQVCSLLLMLAANAASGQNPCGSALLFNCTSTGEDCISVTWRCDGRPDCVNGEDEQNCECTRSQFRCNTGALPAECIGALQRCDGQNDCSNGADEQNCLCDTSTQFQCTGGDSLCIPKIWVCDGSGDCDDPNAGSIHSDELNCPTSVVPPTLTCRTGEFKCTDNTRCIPDTWQCDGQRDCLDGSDEPATCMVPTGPTACQDPTFFQCANKRQCFPQLFYCDGEADCVDRSDEENCGGTLRPVQTFPPATDCPSGNLAQCSGPPLYVLFSTTREIRLLELSTGSDPQYVNIVSNATDVVPMGYVHDDSGVSRIYYTDSQPSGTQFLTTTLDFSGSAPAGAVPKTFSSNFTGTPKGFAIDWIAKNIYWTAIEANMPATIQVARLDGSRRQVIHQLDANVEPGHIVVDHSRGLLFWAERFPTPKIMRSDVFGKNVLKISPLSGQALGTPSALTIDTAGQKLYVSDRLNGNVEQVSYDGMSRVLLFRDRVEGIRSLDFYNGVVYGTQVDRSGVSNGRLFRIQVNNDRPRESVRSDLRTGLYDPQDVRVVFAASQPANSDNPCSSNNGGCEGLCFAFGTTVACSCNSDASKPFLAADGRTCASIPSVRVDKTGRVDVAERSDLQARCSVVNSPYMQVQNLIWKLNGVNIPGSYMQADEGSERVSMLNALNLGAGGQYTCELTYVLNTAPGTVSPGPVLSASSAQLDVVVTPVESSNTTTIIIAVVVSLVVLVIIVVVVAAVWLHRRRATASTTFGNPIYGANKAEDDQVNIVTTSSSSNVNKDSESGNGTSI